jgi:hypothetical protein
MTAYEAFAALLKEHIAPTLAAEGFGQTERTFHRPVGRNWEVIGFEHSGVAGSDRLKLSAHLAVGIHRLRGTGYDWADGTCPSEADCHFSVDLGQLLTGRNVWWDLRSGSDVGMLGESLVEAIRRYGLPWLEERSNDERLRNAYLADLDSVAWWELRPLRKLVDQLGPNEARQALDAELRRRRAQRELPDA